MTGLRFKSLADCLRGRWLFEVAGNGCEGGGELSSNGFDRRNNHHSDERGDKAIFNGRRGILVADKADDQIPHLAIRGLAP
jgi:hypothetical protein